MGVEEAYPSRKIIMKERYRNDTDDKGFCTVDKVFRKVYLA